MNTAKKKRLESAGWRVGAADDFLGLSQEEARVVEKKLAFSGKLAQKAPAKKLGSSRANKGKPPSP